MESFTKVSIFSKVEVDITYSGINFPKHYLPSQIMVFQYFPNYFFLPILEMYFPKIYCLESFLKASIFPKLEFDITYSGINFPKHYSYLPSPQIIIFEYFPNNGQIVSSFPWLFLFFILCIFLTFPQFWKCIPLWNPSRKFRILPKVISQKYGEMKFAKAWDLCKKWNGCGWDC